MHVSKFVFRAILANKKVSGLLKSSTRLLSQTVNFEVFNWAQGCFQHLHTTLFAELLWHTGAHLEEGEC